MLIATGRYADDSCLNPPYFTTALRIATPGAMRCTFELSTTTVPLTMT